MNYYIEELPKCAGRYCDRRATHEVKSSGTASYGRFCKRHAANMRRALQDHADQKQDLRRSKVPSLAADNV